MDSVKLLHDGAASIFTFLHDILIQLTEVIVNIAIPFDWACFSSFR
jgi:hypothetical protein